MLWLADFLEMICANFHDHFMVGTQVNDKAFVKQIFSVNLARLFNGFLIESQTGNQSLHMPCRPVVLLFLLSEQGQNTWSCFES